MITDGSLALKRPLNPRQAEMEAYLSSEGGYWLQNDIWHTDSEAYRASGIRKSRRDGILADLSGYPDNCLKQELKYYLLCSLKNQWRSPAYVQDVLMTPIRLLGERIAGLDACHSFTEIEENRMLPLPDGTTPAVAAVYHGLIKTVREFFEDYYDDRDELEKDVWHALKIPGTKLSAAMKRKHPSMVFTAIPDDYRSMVKRFMKRLVIRRSWSYCSEMLMYIRYFFRAFLRAWLR